MQELCKVDNKKAIEDLALVLQNEPAESDYRAAQIEHLVEFVNVHYSQLLEENQPFLFNLQYVQEFHIIELQSTFNEAPESQAIMDARDEEERIRVAGATSALTSQ